MLVKCRQHKTFSKCIIEIGSVTKNQKPTSNKRMAKSRKRSIKKKNLRRRRSLQAGNFTNENPINNPENPIIQELRKSKSLRQMQYNDVCRKAYMNRKLRGSFAVLENIQNRSPLEISCEKFLRDNNLYI